MLQILSLLCSVGSLACLIIMVIPLFQEKGALHGILGIICGIYTFIWGWMNATRLGKKQIMLIWTGLIIASVILNVVVGMSAASSIQATP
jgi:hypothetical protein